jgi:hypothetical protein
MFDNTTTNPTNQNQPPQNLPTAGPAPIAPTPPLKIESGFPPEDILGEIDKVEPAIKGPAMPGIDWKQSLPPAVTPPQKPVTKEPFVTQHKKAIVAVVVILLAGGALAAAGWYGYSIFILAPQANPTPAINTGAPNPSANQPDAANVNEPVVNTNQPQANENANLNAEPVAPVDSDQDGLTDEEEGMYGTNPSQADTDADGLTDRDEVKVFETDPNNPDTDGDTYLDGAEIRGGYDPKGPGKLLNLPQ